MAKKKKRSPAKKKEEPKKNTGFWRGVWAIALIIAGVVLAFGAFIDAPVPKGFWDGVWTALGVSTIIVPLDFLACAILPKSWLQTKSTLRLPLPAIQIGNSRL
jgi:hypothetical protein